MRRHLIERAGVKVTVRAKAGAAAELVEAALTGTRAKPVNKAQGIKLTVSGKQGEWHLRDHATDVRRKLTNPGDLIYHLTDRIVFHIADQASGGHCLHAAAVSHQADALLIPANSGAGKSTFTAWLVANGFGYITDELIIVDADQKIDGLARPIQIKPHGIAAIEPLLKTADAIFPGKLANAVPISALGGSISELAQHRAGLMIFPSYQKGSQYSFEKLSSAQAGMNLMANHVNARNLEGHGFRSMMAMIRATPCYALQYGGFDSLPADFIAQLQALMISELA